MRKKNDSNIEIDGIRFKMIIIGNKRGKIIIIKEINNKRIRNSEKIR